MRRWPRGALVGVVAGTGLLIGLRAIAGIDGLQFVTFLQVQSFPLESLGVSWSEHAVWPGQLQGVAATKLIMTIGALFLGAVTIGSLNAAILLSEGTAGRRGELAIRSAVGATPFELARMLLLELRTLVLAGVSIGIVAGLTGGLAVRLAWPGATIALHSVSTFDAVAAILGTLGLVVLAHVGAAWQGTRAGRAVRELKAGARAGSDPFAVFVRKTLAATHVAVAGAVLVAIVTLSEGLSVEEVGEEGARTMVIDATSPSLGGWAPALSAIASIPGIEAESLSAPGSLVGLGVRDIAITECGQCIRGLLPAPLWNALADHHVVATGFFEMTDTDLVEGRVFSSSDEENSEPVVIVNQTFARTAFENGAPVGKRIRVGSDFDGWYTVVGVVEDRSFSVLGAEGRAREAVYLSAGQQPLRSAHVLLRGSDESVSAAQAILADRGFDPSEPVSLGQHRLDATLELLWAWRLAVLLGLITVGLAAHGIYEVALQTSRRRRFEVAVRRAAGATSLRIATYVMGERLRVTAWGLSGVVFLGTLTAAFLENSAGMPVAGPRSYLLIGGFLATVAALASIRATREALEVEPASLLR